MRFKKTRSVALMLLFLPALVCADLIDILSEPVMMNSDSMPMREISLKVGFDFNGWFDTNEIVDGTDTKNLKAGNNVSFAAEYFKYFNEYLAAGAGLSAQMPRWIDDVSGNFGFAPAYLAVKVRSWPQDPGMYGYVVGHLGYNFFYGDDDSFKSKDNGVYYGIGLGIVYKAFLAEGLYGVNNGAVKDAAGNKIDVEYGKWTIFVGYKL